MTWKSKAWILKNKTKQTNPHTFAYTKQYISEELINFFLVHLWTDTNSRIKQNFKGTEVKQWGVERRDGSPVGSTCCSCEGLGILMAAHNCLNWSSLRPYASSCPHRQQSDTCMQERHTQRTNTSLKNNRRKYCINNKESGLWLQDHSLQTMHGRGLGKNRGSQCVSKSGFALLLFLIFTFGDFE